MKAFAIIALLITALALATNQPAPKAAASPAPPDRSAEVAKLQAEVASLQSQLASALETPTAQVVEPDASSGSRETGASDAYSKPAATSLLGVPTSTAALMAYPSPPSARSQSYSGGTCQPAASVPKRYEPMRRKALLPWRR